MTQPAQFATPEDAEHAFYDAIKQGDADLLCSYWSDDEECACVHPTGVRILGLDPIRESWRSIFKAARLRIEAEPVSHWHSMVLAVHHLVETLYLDDDPAPQGTLHVTHVYSRGAYGWRMICRHASAANDGSVASSPAPTESRILH